MSKLFNFNVALLPDVARPSMYFTFDGTLVLLSKIGIPPTDPEVIVGRISKDTVIGITDTFAVELLPANVPTLQEHSAEVKTSLYTPGAFVASTSEGEFVGAEDVPFLIHLNV
jgi:hypothetical protein